jgi:hypothetical protein
METLYKREGVLYWNECTACLGLTKTIDWIREHVSLIDACIQRHGSHMPLPRELSGAAS